MIAGLAGGVNRAPGVWLLLGVLGCHMGRPPGPRGGISVGDVVAPVAEPGAADALKGGLARGLAGAGVPRGPRHLDCHILEASDQAVAVGASGVRAHRARVAARCRLSGARPREVVLTAERSYVGDPRDSLGTAGRRAEAVALAARDVADQAVAWVLYSPPSTAP